MPGTARLRGGSHALRHARQSTGGYAQALLLTLDPVARPDERREGKTAAPDQRMSIGTIYYGTCKHYLVVRVRRTANLFSHILEKTEKTA